MLILAGAYDPKQKLTENMELVMTPYIPVPVRTFWLAQ